MATFGKKVVAEAEKREAERKVAAREMQAATDQVEVTAANAAAAKSRFKKVTPIAAPANAAAAPVNAAEVKPVEFAAEGVSRDDANAALAKLKGKGYTNKATGITARLSSNGAGKLVSNAATAKSQKNGFTKEQHNSLAANIDILFENAVLLEERPDKNGDVNIRSIRRFVCPVRFGDNEAAAYITVKESVEHGHRIYSVEGMKIAELSPMVRRALSGRNSADNPASANSIAKPAADVKPVEFTALTPTGNRKVGGHYEVAPLAELMDSNQPGYPMELQARDRKDNKAEEQTREDHIANFEPGYLLADPGTDGGAPLVVRKTVGGRVRLVVVSGNGRTMILQALAERHLYDRYRDAMKEWAAKNGVEIGVGDEANPVLIRVIDDLGGATLKEIADLSNTNAIQQMNEDERARSDAEVIRTLGIARLYQANADGSPDMTPGANEEFFAAFQRGIGQNDALYNPDGTLTQGARDRAVRALVAIAVGQGARGRDTVKKLALQADTLGLNRQRNAAAAMAAAVADLERKSEYAIGEDVSRAYADYMDFIEQKKQGKVATLGEYVAQPDMLDQRSEIAEGVLELLGGSRNAREIAETVKTYCRAAEGEDPNGNLFGAARTREQIWRDAVATAGGDGARHSVSVSRQEYAVIRSEAYNKLVPFANAGKELPRRIFVNTFDKIYRLDVRDFDDFDIVGAYDIDEGNDIILKEEQEAFENALDRVTASYHSDDEKVRPLLRGSALRASQSSGGREAAGVSGVVRGVSRGTQGEAFEGRDFRGNRSDREGGVGRLSIALAEAGEKPGKERQERLSARYSFAAAAPITLTGKDIALAISKWGTTDDINKAIYCLPDGTMLRGKDSVFTFGGRRIEAFGHDGWVDLILENAPKVDVSTLEGLAEAGGQIEAAQRAIYATGAIRISGDKNGFTVSREPTEAQYDALYDMAEKAYLIMEENGDDEMLIDVTDENLRTLFTLRYARGTSPRRIIEDLRGWYERGENPAERERSMLAEFHRWSVAPKGAQKSAAVEYPDAGEELRVMNDAARDGARRSVAELQSQRPYLNVNQATDGALSDSGNPEAALTHSPVAAARRSLDQLARIIANRPNVAQGVFDSLRTALKNIEDGKPVFVGGRELSAKNFVTSMQALGFSRKAGANSAYLVIGGDSVIRASDHSANAELFVQDGTDNNLSIVIRRPHSMAKKFASSDSANVVEAVFTRRDLDEHPEKLPYIVRDIAEFIATGEYHDTAGAMAYNYSGSDEYQAAVRDRIHADAIARGDMETAARMVHEAAAKAMPDTKVVNRTGEIKPVYHGTPNGAFTKFDKERIGETWNADDVGFFFTSSKSLADDYTRPFFKESSADPHLFNVYLNITNPLVIDRKWWQQNFGRSDIYKHDAIEIWDNCQREILDALKAGSYDGVIVDPNPFGGEPQMYVAFGPEQIKSADPVTYDDAGNLIPLSQRFDQKNPDIRWSIGARRRAEFRELIARKRPDIASEDVAAYLDEIAEYDNAKKQKLAVHWIITGAIELPEDAYKLDKAIATAERAKVDPFRYRNPEDIFAAFPQHLPKEKPIDPDTVPELTGKRDMGHGVTVYNVSEKIVKGKRRAGQVAMRKVINTHWGKDASPWCLLQGDGNGELTEESRGYWEHYSALPKKVAFLNGRLLAFMATDRKGRRVVIENDEWGDLFPTNVPEQWWDRKDVSHDGIPIEGKIEGDALGRSGLQELKDGKLELVGRTWKGDRKNGRYEEWEGERKKLDAEFKDGRPVGWRRTYRNGELSTAEHFNEKSEHDRPQLEFYPGVGLARYVEYGKGDRPFRSVRFAADGTLESYQEPGGADGFAKVAVQYGHESVSVAWTDDAGDYYSVLTDFDGRLTDASTCPKGAYGTHAVDLSDAALRAKLEGESAAVVEAAKAEAAAIYREYSPSVGAAQNGARLSIGGFQGAVRSEIGTGEVRFSIGTAWRPDFPDATAQTTRAYINGHYAELFKRAKAGDIEAAKELVEKVCKVDKILQLGKDHPKARIVAPVIAQEASGHNQIPRSFAKYVAAILGIETDTGIVQTVRANHTGSAAEHRLFVNPEFDGEVVRGAEYIVVDDHITQGGTVDALRDHIERNGGKVVAVASLTLSQGSSKLSPRKDTLDELYAKWPDIDNLLRIGGIAESAGALTQSQAKYILKFSPDTFRDRAIAQGNEGGGRVPGEALGASPSEEVSRPKRQEPRHSIAAADNPLAAIANAKTTRDVETAARMSFGARLADGDARAAENALVNYVAYHKLTGGALPRATTLARLGLALGMKTVSAKRIIEDAQRVADRAAGTVIEKAARNGDVGTAFSLMEREKERDEELRRVVSGAAKAGGDLVLGGVVAQNTIIGKRIEQAMRTMTAADLADMNEDTGIDLAAEILANDPKAFDDELKPMKPQRGDDSAPDGMSSDEDGQPAERTLTDREKWMREEAKKAAAKRVQAFIEAAKQRAEENRKKAEERRAREAAARAAGEEPSGGGEGGEAGGGGEAGEGQPSGASDPNAPEKSVAGFKNKWEFAAFVRKWAEDKYAKTHGMTTFGRSEENRLFANFYRICVQKQLQDLADKLLDPKGARAWVNRRIGELAEGMRPDTIERESADIFAFINRNAIREERVKLIEKFRKEIRQFITGAEFEELKVDSTRRLTGWVEEAARYMMKVCQLSGWAANGGTSQFERERQRLVDIIQARRDVYAASGVDTSLAEKEDKDTIKAMWMLSLLEKFGAMAQMMPGEIEDLRTDAIRYLTEEAAALEERWKDAKAWQDGKKRALAGGIEGPNGQRYESKMGYFGQLFDALNGMLRLRLKHLMRFAGKKERAEGEAATNEIVTMLGQGEVEYARVVQRDRAELCKALGRIFRKSDGRLDRKAAVAYMKRMEEPIPVELSRQLSFQGYAKRMTYGQMLQLLVSLEQKSYAKNVKACGREGQAELIRNSSAFTVEDAKFIEWLRAFYEAKREEISAVTERMTGMKVESPDPLYCPVKIYRKDVASDLHRDPGRWNAIDEVLSSRVRHKRDFDESATILGQFYDRSNRMAGLVAWAERGTLIQNVICSSAVQQRIRLAFGGAELDKILSQLEDTFNGGQSRSKTPGEIVMMDKAMNFVTFSVVIR